MSSPPPPDERDVRTLRPGKQRAALVLLAAFAAYLAACGHAVVASYDSPLGRAAPGLAWFGGWGMFTTVKSYHRALELHAFTGREWVAVDGTELFTTTWSGGTPRFEHGRFYTVSAYQGVLANATCQRLAARGDEPVAVRVRLVTWPKVFGDSRRHPGPDAHRDEGIAVPCDGSFPDPPGAVW